MFGGPPVICLQRAAAETKCPRPTLRSNEDKFGGWEFATLSFPCRHWALASRRLPASRRHSPRQTESPASWQGRPTSCDIEFRVRLFSSLRLVVAPPACEPGQDTSAISLSRLDHLTLDGHRFLTVRWPAPRVSPLNSQVAFRSQASGVVFNIADAWKLSRDLPCLRVLPVACALFVHLSMVFFGRFQTV